VTGLRSGTPMTFSPRGGMPNVRKSLMLPTTPSTLITGPVASERTPEKRVTKASPGAIASCCVWVEPGDDNNVGKLKWDYSFPLDDVKLPAVEQTADFDLASNSVYFIYKKDHELKVKQIPLDGENPSEYTEEIKLEFSTDEVRSGTEREGNVRFWFGDSFYVWGIQNIRNNTKADKVRRVFYINRLVAH
jgi:hypothetical protein